MEAQRNFNEKGHTHNAKIAWVFYFVVEDDVADVTPSMEDMAAAA